MERRYEIRQRVVLAEDAWMVVFCGTDKAAARRRVRVLRAKSPNGEFVLVEVVETLLEVEH